MKPLLCQGGGGGGGEGGISRNKETFREGPVVMAAAGENDTKYITDEKVRSGSSIGLNL